MTAKNRVRDSETRFDQFSGNWMERQNSTRAQPGVKINFGKRFCVSCKTFKPRDKTPAMKGWRCAECKGETA